MVISRQNQKMDSTELLQKIGKKIKSLREGKGITQQELAALCNFEKSNMSRIEAGRTNITVATLYTISNALEVKIEEMFL